MDKRMATCWWDFTSQKSQRCQTKSSNSNRQKEMRMSLEPILDFPTRLSVNVSSTLTQTSMRESTSEEKVVARYEAGDFLPRYDEQKIDRNTQGKRLRMQRMVVISWKYHPFAIFPISHLLHQHRRQKTRETLPDRLQGGVF